MKKVLFYLGIGLAAVGILLAVIGIADFFWRDGKNGKTAKI